MRRIAVLVGLLLVTPALAQQSASFKVTESVFSGGGFPEGGVAPTSKRFMVTLSSVGSGAAGVDSSSPSFQSDTGFVAAYPPPGEVVGLLFSSKTTLEWWPENSAGSYRLYRDLLSELLGLGFGECQPDDIADETATDTDPVPAGDGYFYLITARNLLNEEGTKGFQSSQTERQGEVCP